MQNYMNNAFSHIRNYLSYLMRMETSEYLDFVEEFGNSVEEERLGAFLLEKKYIEYCGFLTIAGLEMIPRELQDFSGLIQYLNKEEKLKDDFEKKRIYINKKIKFFLGKERNQPPIFADSIVKEICSKILDRNLFFSFLDYGRFRSLSLATDEYIKSILGQYKGMFSPNDIVLVENINGDLEKKAFCEVFGEKILQDFQIKDFKNKLIEEMGSYIALKSRKEF